MKPHVCQVCGDPVVFGQLLPTGAVCVDCGGVATQEPKAPTNNQKSGAEAASASSASHTKTDGVGNPASEAPRAAEDQESKGEPAPPGSAGDRARDGVVGRPTASVATRPAHDVGRPTTPSLPPSDVVVDLVAEACEFKVADLRPFAITRTSRSEQLSIEVEEWIYGIKPGFDPDFGPREESLVLVRTPREIFPARRPTEAFPGWNFEVCRFVVVLEHRLPDSDVTLRDIGPSFTPRPGSRDDRAAALNTASGWARSQAVRLKADPPLGYRAAREIS